jgi:hypothetical protein
MGDTVVSFPTNLGAESAVQHTPSKYNNPATNHCAIENYFKKGQTADDDSAISTKNTI